MFNLFANEKHKINIYFFFTICLGHKKKGRLDFKRNFPSGCTYEGSKI